MLVDSNIPTCCTIHHVVQLCLRRNYVNLDVTGINSSHGDGTMKELGAKQCLLLVGAFCEERICRALQIQFLFLKI
jgi:hypothetical protein